jgi:hypothetical protein
MRTIMLLMALSCCGTAAAVDTAAQRFRGSLTGEEMLTACKAFATEDPVRDFEKGICRGFIDGFFAGHHAAELWHAFHHRDESLDRIYGRLCVPKDVNRNAIAVVLIKYLEKNREKSKWNAGLLLESALKEAFPCPP